MLNILNERQSKFITTLKIFDFLEEEGIKLRILDENLDYHQFSRESNRNGFRYTLWQILLGGKDFQQKMLSEIKMFTSIRRNCKMIVLTSVDEEGMIFELEYYFEPTKKLTPDPRDRKPSTFKKKEYGRNYN